MSTQITRSNLMPSPNPTEPVGAATVKFTAHMSTAGSVTNTVGAEVDQGRAVVKINIVAGTSPNAGTRTTISTNSPNVQAGKTFWFSADVFVPTANSGVTGLQAVMRDDPNNDSAAVVFDAATPAFLPIASITRGQWFRVAWKATVNASRTITGIYLYLTNSANHFSGAWWETSRWLVEEQSTAAAKPYFDGDSTDVITYNQTTLYDWTGTEKASPSVEVITTYAPTLTLSWLDDQGAVRFEAKDMKPNDTVFMVGPSNRLVLLRGYENADWHEGTTDGYGYHYEMPLGMEITYCIADAGADYYDAATMAHAKITTPDNEAWLRDLVVPDLSQKVAVVSTDDEIRQGRQTLITIAGRQNPLSLYDVRLSRSGTITLLVVNQPGQSWGYTSKERMDAILYSGRPLLFSMCMSKGFQPLYMSANDVTYTKVSSSTRAAWLAKINYQEVDNPTDVGLTFAAEVTWDMSRSMPVANATYQQWKDSYPTFQDLVLDRPSSIPERDA